MPTTEGDYEVRLFEQGGYTLVTTSPIVTVENSAPPDPDPGGPATLDVSATLVASGDTVTVTLSGGPGNAQDWLALAEVGGPDTTFLQWVYVPAGNSDMIWDVTMPATPGDYEIRLFENAGYSRLATSVTITVEATEPDPPPPAPPDPTLDLSATTANGGDTVTVTLADGPGHNNDWLALAEVGSPNTTYLQWTYVPAGATSMVWDVTMPATPGNYEVRLFEYGGYTRIATSETIVVTP